MIPTAEPLRRSLGGLPDGTRARSRSREGDRRARWEHVTMVLVSYLQIKAGGEDAPVLFGQDTTQNNVGEEK